MIIEGVISSRQDREVQTKFGAKNSIKIEVNGEKIDVGFNKCSFKEGDAVRVDCEEPKGQYGWKPRSISASTKTAAELPKPKQEFLPVRLSRDRSIIRQNALNVAVGLFQGQSPMAEDVIALARQFEEYTSGDADFEAMEIAEDELLNS